MSNLISKRFDFGKIAYTSKRKLNKVTIHVSLRYNQGKPVFTASGSVYNASGTECVICGQCLDEIHK